MPQNTTIQYNKDKADFGYKSVDSAEKSSLVREVFRSVAPKYDVMNDLMSGGLHRLWKRYLVTDMQIAKDEVTLDMASGTGDIAKAIYSQYQSPVVMCDINESMLQVGKQQLFDHGITRGIATHCADAENLPYPDQWFDYYVIAFGLRNVTHRQQALQEAYRVLKPGGQFYCLEFSKVTLPIFARCYDLYSFAVIPRLGRWITGDASSYQYLVESIRLFPAQETLANELTATGFCEVSYQNITQGIVALHKGFRI